jgi:glycosyltransferase involved in cell wall biosynthesis
MGEITGQLTIVAVFPWWKFWMMGEGEGSPSFFLSPKGFVDAGHRMIVVMPRAAGLPATETYHGMEIVRYRAGFTSVLDEPDHPKLWRFLRRHAIYWWYQVVAFLAALRVCRRERPGVIIGYGDQSPPATWLLGKVAGLPTVHRCFGTSLAPAVGNPFKLLYRYIEVLALRIPARALVLVNDGSDGDKIARRLGVPIERIRFWRNGMNHDLFDPLTPARTHRDALGLPPEGPLLYTVSRFHPQKHIERILQALPDVFNAHPGAHCVLVGDGPERPFLEAEVARLGLDDRVLFTGALDQTQLKAVNNACDVFVAMSDRTNAANPLFEAMIAGRPGVVLDSGATSDVIEHDVNGWLVPEAYPERLSAVLSAILGDGSRISEVGQAARRWAVEHIPTWKERQRMEVEVVEEVVRAWRAERGAV